MTTQDDLLSTIERRIEEARRMVTEQKGRIARLKAAGTDTSLAEKTLSALEANLMISKAQRLVGAKGGRRCVMCVS